MKNNYSYAGVAFIILIFGIWGANELGTRIEKRELVKFEKVPDFNFSDLESAYKKLLSSAWKYEKSIKSNG